MPIGRYAPSPTGTFHIGNLRTAVAAFLFARSAGSDFLLRWEDLDVTADPRHEASQRQDLTTLGLDFDGEVVRQSDRLEIYADAIADLERRHLTYRCWCSRREIREAAAAPHGSSPGYPGTCRELTSAQIARHEESGRPPALRLLSDLDDVSIVDSLHGHLSRPMDDIVLRRGDGTPAYNLVVVIDDHEQGVEQVVRADDLLDSTPRHAYLQRVFGFAEPTWTHVPVVVDHEGERLAKRDGSAGLAEWMRAGGTVETLLADIGRTLGVTCGPRADIGDLVAGFGRAAVPLTPAILRLDGPELSLSA